MKKILNLLLFVLSAMIAKAQTDVHIDAPAIKRTVDTSQIYTAVEKPAAFPGGIKSFYDFLEKNGKYPASAKGQAAQRVFIQFVVQRDGTLTNIRIVRGASPDLDAEAIRLITSSPPWIPGEQNGQKIKQQFTVPINFTPKDKQ